MFSKYFREDNSFSKNKSGRFHDFAEIQVNHRDTFGDDYFLVTFDQDKISSFEKQYMESGLLDQYHHIAYKKNAGCHTLEEPDAYMQWRSLTRKAKRHSTKDLVIKEVCLVNSFFQFLHRNSISFISVYVRLQLILS